MTDKKLNVGDKYLSVVVSEGGVDKTYFVPVNKDSTKENKQPSYRISYPNHSVAVWVNVKREPKVATETVEA